MNRLFIDNSIGTILSRVAHGELQSSQLAVIALENIAEFDKDYFAWVTYGGEAVERARMHESPDGLLANIPIGVKDIYNTIDFPTQMGSELWKDFTPGNDARAVFNLKREGAVVVGKTATAEFAVHALDKTRNPYDCTRTPGTSSSGSAVAVALGLVPAATGTQTAGSIVRPASFCGVYACKPSFGTIPRTGMLKTTDSLDTLGFFTVFGEDLRRMFDSMRVAGPNYPISNAALSDEGRQKKSANRPWKIAFVKTHTWNSAPLYAKDAIEAFIQRLASEPGFEVTEAELPESMSASHETHATIYDKSLSYYFQNEYSHGEKISSIMKHMIETGKRIEPAAFASALGRQSGMIRDMDVFFSGYDALLCLSTAGEAPLRETTELPDPALMWTLTHLPVVSVPAFRSPSNLPFGLQLASRKYNDYLLFNLLNELCEKGFVPSKSSYFA